MIIPLEGPRALFAMKGIEVMAASGLIAVDALCYRDFGIVRRGGVSALYFEVFHLPSALSFCSAGGCFSREDVACRAVVRIDRLRNEWSQVTLPELVGMSKAVGDVCKGFGGKPPANWLTDTALDNTHNGYSGSAA